MWDRIEIRDAIRDVCKGYKRFSGGRCRHPNRQVHMKPYQN
jgi:hypothetical protein